MTPTIIQIIITIIGSGAVFSFLQFLINRHDVKEEKKDNNEIDNLRQEMKQHLINVNDNWKKTYCDRNYQRVEDLTKEVREGLKEREDKGLERYNEHRETINELKQAILQLVENDTNMKNYMETIGESLMGLSHDRIIQLSDKFSERGAITLREKATLKSIYNPYKKLGGNGDCAEAFEYVNNLPVVSEEKAKRMDAAAQTEDF